MKKVQDYLIVLIGTFILAVSVKMFILPYHILSGGVAGIAVALEPMFHLDPDLVINVLIYGMFFLGAAVLGKEFAIKTVLSSMVYPLYLAVLDPFVFVMDVDPLVASIYGGALAGLGVGMVMRTGSSTGGTDIPPLILHRFFHFDIAKSVMVIDALTVLLGFVAYGPEAVLIGMISVVASSYVIDLVLTFGGQKCRSVQIISDAYEVIMMRIHDEMERGTTVFEAHGGYTQKERKVLLVVIETKEYVRLMNIVNECDPSAFVITSEVKSVHGEGFLQNFKI